VTPEERKQRREERKSENQRRHIALPQFLIRDRCINISMEAGEDRRLEICIDPKYLANIQKESGTSTKYRRFFFYLESLDELGEFIAGLAARYNETVREMNQRSAGLKLEQANRVSVGKP